MDLFDNTSFDIFDIPESLSEFPITNVPNPKKINLNNLNDPKRESYLKKLREKIEKNKGKYSS